jgi:uncharacterized membrane protein YsdA (DUF1294 family)
MPWKAVLIVYAAASLVSFVTYWIDKRRSGRGQWRVSENTLHLLELVGGWPGALLAMKLFRHKTRKLSFLLVTWAIVVLHGVGWWYFVLRVR